MFYVPFHEHFPDLARTETRSATVVNNPYLPDGEYGLIELYCNKPGCDCRRVMFNIVTPDSPKALAVIAYGWESAEFYARWFGSHNPQIIQQMQGLVLNPNSPQSELAPGLLELVRYLLADEVYLARIKRHYTLFKQAVNEKAGRTSQRRPQGARFKSKKGKQRGRK